MNEIFEHPQISRALLTGYPEEEPEPVRCEDCGEQITADEKVFLFDDEAVCENCCRDRIEDNFDIEDLARALNITVKSMDNYLSELEGD